MICPNCQHEVVDNIRFCPNCGHILPDKTPSEQVTLFQTKQQSPAVKTDNRWVVAIVAIISVAVVVVAVLFMASRTDGGSATTTAQSTTSTDAVTASSTGSSTANSDTSGSTRVYTRYVNQPDGYANVRRGRSTSYSIVGTLSNGTKVRVSNLQNGWYQLASGDYEGYYISAKTLSNRWNSYDDGVLRYVSEPDGYANVRNGRGTNYSVVGTLTNGTAVNVNHYSDGWYQIVYGEYAGYYISKDTLTENK